MINRRGVLHGGGLLAASLLLAACGGAGPARRGPGTAAGHNDINPLPREQVRDGGDLRWPLDNFPPNINYNQFDGSSGETFDVIGALLPSLFVGTADGGLRLNTDYLTAATLTSTAPQVVTYTIHPRATWSDGTPVTWHDFAAQWAALNGTDPAFLISSKTGYEDIGSVRRGSDDKQVVVTFASVFAEWQSLFSPLYPASTNGDPAAFNTGWLRTIPVTAGPFAAAGVDPGAQTITVRRDPRWWGAPAKLDRILFKVADRSALADNLANNELDFYPIGSSVDLYRRARTTVGATIREAPERQYNHVTFNGAPGAILSDARLRRAIAKGINRHDIAQRLVGQVVSSVITLDNHIYPYGSRSYQANAASVVFDQAEAGHELDALGWTRPSPNAVRTKGGRPLTLRFTATAENPIADAISRTVQNQLGLLGVQVVINSVSAAEFFVNHINLGDFDLTGFLWASTAAPFSSSRSIYAQPVGNNVQQNYGRIFSPEITALFDQGIRELDDTKRAALGNQVDQLIWQEVHHLPLYPSTGAYAVRSTLANFGAPGFADIDYLNAGFAK